MEQLSTININSKRNYVVKKVDACNIALRIIYNKLYCVDRLLQFMFSVAYNLRMLFYLYLIHTVTYLFQIQHHKINYRTVHLDVDLVVLSYKESKIFKEIKIIDF